MNAHKANLLNALTLMVLSLADFATKANASVETMIPLVFGVILLSLSNGIYYGVRSQLKTSLPVTITIFILLFWEIVTHKLTLKMWMPWCMAGTCLTAMVFIGRELNHKKT